MTLLFIRGVVFFVDDDRRVYLELLAEQADKYGLEITGYCLMRNHVHLVAVPKVEEALAKAVGRTVRWADEMFGYAIGAAGEDLTADTRDSAGFAPDFPNNLFFNLRTFQPYDHNCASADLLSLSKV